MKNGTEELLRLRDEAAKAYYEGTPIMEDTAFDSLTIQLDALGVPSEVGHGYTVSGTTKVEHAAPMLSLNKVRTEEELLSWAHRSGVQHFAVMPKYDGLALSIVYGGAGEIEVAATRGDGVLGENVTHTAAAMARAGHLPARLGTPSAPLQGSVRGEVFMTHDDLAALNTLMEGREGRTYVNTRNAAAGILRRDDTELAGFLSFVAYSAEIDALSSESDPQVMEWLAQQGFLTPLQHYYRVCTQGELPGAVSELEGLQRTLEVELDGAVFKVERPLDRERLGVGRTAPNWAVAYKYPNVLQDTTLRAVTWNTGRTGRIIPTGTFDPVTLSGASVSNATLHNATYLKALDLKLGDTISVTRSNEVIPYVVGRVGEHPEGSAPIEWPVSCPSCASPVVENGADLVCSQGPGCNQVAGIVHALRCVGVDGVAGALVGALIESGAVTHPLDLFTVQPHQIEQLERFGATSAAKAVAALQEGLHAPLWCWIAAVGLPGVGPAIAEQLAERFGSLEGVAEATEEQLLELPNFGESRVTVVLAGADRFRVWAHRLRTEQGVVPANEESLQGVASPLTGRRVVVTGALPTLTRDAAQEYLVMHGATVQSGVSRTTDLVVAGERAGSKMAKARELGIEVMDGETFERLVLAH